ncbi:MAG: ABC transporter ATP-binding protein [Acidimicrobiales bacterium]
MKVEVDGVRVVIDHQPILDGVSLAVGPGEFHALIGPNGSGKSTLLRCLYRALRPATGVVKLGGDDVWADLSARSAARRRAIVAQEHVIDLAFTVRELVLLGRAPHKGMFERDGNQDLAVADDALEQVGMAWAADRVVTTLSGGERQRALLARALTQQAPILLLDEPTNHLDVRAQLELLELARSLKLTTLAALHDLDQAAAVCDGITVLSAGRVVASGHPDEVLTAELIEAVFGVRAVLGIHPLTGRRHVMTALPTDLSHRGPLGLAVPKETT